MYNYVRIDTAFNHCTGIIFSCQAKKNYIIITNKHLISIEDNFEKEIEKLIENQKIEELEKYFDYKISDKNGNILNDKVKLKSVFVSNNYEIDSDIMVFLVEIDSDELMVNNYICHNDNDVRDVFLEGYPGILEAEKFYKNLYNVIEKAFGYYIEEKNLEKNYFPTYCERKIVFSSDISESTEKRELLIKCLKIHEGDSISALIDKIEIHDSLSNDYSYILDSLGLTKIKLIDTKGLDHIEEGIVKEEYIYKVIQKEK